MSAGYNWNAYQQLHHQQFVDARQSKYLVVNGKDEVVGRHLQFNNLQLNAATTVRHEDFRTIDQEIIRVRREALHGIADLEAAGLTQPAKLSDQLVGFETVSDGSAAKQEMNPGTYDNDDTAFSLDNVPNPITHKTFSVPWRQTGFEYKTSLGLEDATRKVSEKMEDTLFLGNSDIKVTVGGVPAEIFGYTNHPNTQTDTISDWSLEANRDLIIPELIEQVGQLRKEAKLAEKSVILYLGLDFFSAFDKDYIAGQVSKTIKEKAMDNVWIKDVKLSDRLGDKQALLVEMSRRTVSLAVASNIIAVPHIKVTPLDPQAMTIYAAMVHIIRPDVNGKVGIRFLTI